MNVGKRIKVIRSMMNMTQAEFAEEIGLSRSYIGDLENNRKSPSINTLIKISDKLNIKIGKLIGDEETKY